MKKNIDIIAVVSALALVVLTCFALDLRFKPFNHRDPKVSVIIPVYNVEKYLDDCLENVVNQTLQDIEIICVNDGSTDNSLEVLQKYENEDARIKIINKENGGLSSARNAGIKEAKGEYILFLDSDDMVSRGVCKNAYYLAKTYGDVDAVEMKTIQFKDGENFSFENAKVQEKPAVLSVIKSGDSSNPFTFLGISRYMIWNKMWRTEFIKQHDLWFKEDGLTFNEDTLFNYMALPYAKRAISAVENKEMIYAYRKNRDESITRSTPFREVARNWVYIISPEILKSADRFDFKDGKSWLVSTLIKDVQSVIMLSEEDRKEWKEDYIKDFLNDIWQFIGSDENILTYECKERLRMLKSYCEMQC